MAEANAAANDKLIKTHKAKVTDDNANWRLTVPANIKPGHYHLAVYASDGRTDAVGTRLLIIQ